MTLKEALQESGLAEAWYQSYTAVVARDRDDCKLTIQQRNQPPYVMLEGLTLEQVIDEVRAMGAPHTLDWSPVEVYG